jgi:hypothetical protein
MVTGWSQPLHQLQASRSELVQGGNRVHTQHWRRHRTDHSGDQRILDSYGFGRWKNPRYCAGEKLRNDFRPVADRPRLRGASTTAFAIK